MASARLRRQLRGVTTVSLVGGLAGALFNLSSREWTLDAAGQGLVDGTLIGLFVGAYMYFVRDGALRVWFRRWNFLTNVVTHSALLAGLFLVARGAGQVVTTGEPVRFLESFVDPHLVWAFPFFFAVAFGISFIVQMNLMVGMNVLGYFVAGRYHRPREEQRIFLFLDLVGSTALAERLGSAAYYGLLRRFVDQLTEPILESRGEIYQYAGDEIVITWRWADGIADAACVRCFFQIEDAVARGAAAYRRDFGSVPVFRAALHGGTVVGGELGDLKREIVFTGDVLNTAGRLEAWAKQLAPETLVASTAVVEALDLPPELYAEPAEELRLRGQSDPVHVQRLRRRRESPQLRS